MIPFVLTVEELGLGGVRILRDQHTSTYVLKPEVKVIAQHGVERGYTHGVRERNRPM